jgi:hypothetical protein
LKQKHANWAIALTALLNLCPLMSQLAIAQDQFRAQISKIASKQNGKQKEIKDPTDKVQYKKNNKPDWEEAEKKTKLYDKDRLLIRPFTFAELEMQGRTAGGHFTLWGDTTEPVMPAAAFEIQKDPVRLGYYALFVTYGSFVADQLRDLITAKSSAMEVKHHGTRYLMTVEKGSGRTTVFVEEGEVTVFARGDSLRLKPMEAAQAVPGGAPAKVNLSAQETSKYLRLIRTNHIELWSHFKPWWQSPWFYVPAALSVGVAAWQWPDPSPENDNRAKGTITVSW